MIGLFFFFFFFLRYFRFVMHCAQDCLSFTAYQERGVWCSSHRWRYDLDLNVMERLRRHENVCFESRRGHDE